MLYNKPVCIRVTTTLAETGEISPITVNGNNTIKIRVIETLFRRYLLSELIFLYISNV